MSDEINVISRTQHIIVEPVSSSVSIINGTGPQGIPGPTGPEGPQGPIGPTGSSGSLHVVLHSLLNAASAPVTNNSPGIWTPITDPNYRHIVDLRGMNYVRMQGRFGGTLHANNVLRIDYHAGGLPNVAVNDSGWSVMLNSAGSHTVNLTFYTITFSVPGTAQIKDCIVRCGVYSGDGVADPTITLCMLNFSALYPG